MVFSMHNCNQKPCVAESPNLHQRRKSPLCNLNKQSLSLLTRDHPTFDNSLITSKPRRNDGRVKSGNEGAKFSKGIVY